MKSKLSLLLILNLSFVLLYAQSKKDHGPNFSPKTVIDNLYDNLSPEKENIDNAVKSISPNIKNAKDSVLLLKKVLDGKGYLLKNSNPPKDPDFLDSNLQAEVFYPIQSEKRVYVEKLGSKWYISDETIHFIPEMYNEVFKIDIHSQKVLKGKFWDKKFLGLTLASWAGFIILTILCITLYTIIYSLFKLIDLKELKKQESEQQLSRNRYYLRLAQYISLFIVSKVFILILPSLELPVNMNSILLKIAGISSVIFIIMIINKIISGIEYLIIHTKKEQHNVNRQLTPIFSKIIRSTIWIIGIIFILYKFMNVNVTALITGISIGGLALALAVQDTVKNFIGSAIILIDKPFELDDWIEFNGNEGQVIEIGIRAIRLKTIEGNNVYVPNNLVSNDLVINKGFRRYRPFKTFITLDYHTSVEQIDQYIEKLKELIKSNAHTYKKNYEVHIYDLADSSINILFFCFFNVKDRSEEYAARHSVLSEILKLSEDMNIKIAFPSQTLYIDREIRKELKLPTELEKPKDKK